uniref:Uncharacterized protein n=1 Tax=Oryza glumipatula TaxID=40148 RepID=A0A0E0AZC9_9ORYZ
MASRIPKNHFIWSTFTQVTNPNLKHCQKQIIQAVYVAMNNLIDLVPATTFADLDSTAMLTIGFASKDI